MSYLKTTFTTIFVATLWILLLFPLINSQINLKNQAPNTKTLNSLSFLPPSSAAYDTDCSLPSEASLGTNNPNPQHCTVTLNSVISSREDYYQLQKMLESFTPADTVVIVLAGNGGSAESLFVLTNYIKRSKADITMKVVGNVYSAHALLALLGNHHVFYPHTVFLFHEIQSGEDGLFDKLYSAVYNLFDDTEVRFMANMDNEMLAHYGKTIKEIMTTQEYKDFLNHKDIFIPSERVMVHVSP